VLTKKKRPLVLRRGIKKKWRGIPQKGRGKGEKRRLVSGLPERGGGRKADVTLC